MGRATRLIVGAMLGLVVPLLLTAPAFAGTVTLIANSVPNLTTSAILFTVPAGQQLLVTDIVISKDSAGAACCARLFRSGAAATAFIATPGTGTVTVHFEEGIRYTAGQTLQVRNGASSGAISFTVHGRTIVP